MLCDSNRLINGTFTHDDDMNMIWGCIICCITTTPLVIPTVAGLLFMLALSSIVVVTWDVAVIRQGGGETMATEVKFWITIKAWYKLS